MSSGSAGNYTVTPFTGTTTITGLPESSTGYKWQVLACDDQFGCSAWTIFNPSAPNFRVDTIAPTAPGALTLSSKTSVTVSLLFGSSTSETNFSRYRIFYSTSTPVTPSSSEQTDGNLMFQNYNGASFTTVENLQPNTLYYFNIWAYDQAGQLATSTEAAVTTNQQQSTPGVVFYTKNTRSLFYKVWDGTAWGTEQTGPTLGSAAGDNIRQIIAQVSDDRGKVAVVAKTWDGANQEWWATVYRFAANSFATSTQLGTAQANATNNTVITACLGSLSGGEFLAVRNNNNANGTLVYNWNNSAGWAAQGAGPNPFAVVSGCSLTRRPGTDNYLLTTFDNTLDVGTSYYTGGATYSNSWTTWTEHSIDESNAQNFVGEAFFDPSDNTRGAFYYSNTVANGYAYAKYIIVDGSSISYGGASSSPQTAPYNWSGRFVQGEFSADPGSAGLAYFAGRDVNGELNVYKVDISSNNVAWSTSTNGDNISSGALYADTNYSQKPFDINFYKNYNALVAWVRSTSSVPLYRKILSTTNTVDQASSSVPGAASAQWTRVRLFQDPNEVETLALYQNTNIDYGAIFWNGGANQFYSSGNQAWRLLATSTGAFSANDAATAFAFTAGNSAPNTPTTLAQQKSDASTTIANGAWTNENQVYLKANATDPDTSEVLTIYAELISATSTFTSSTSQPSGACVWGTTYDFCSSKIWFVASSTAGDYSVNPFVGSVNITGLPDSATGYKWQVIACDDSAACSNWVKFNTITPNFMVDITAPSAPGNLTVYSKTSSQITLAFGSASTEANFSSYRIYYKVGTSGVSEADTQWSDGNLAYINYNGATSTTVTGLASTTAYVFRIWAYDLAGNKATSSSEVSTTTNVGPILRQTSFIFENDDGADVNSNSSAAAASTSLSNLNRGERLISRLQIENVGGDIASGKVYKLQYENYTDAPGTWNDVSNVSEIAYGLGLSGDNPAALTSAKASANGNSWTSGTWHEGTGQTGSFDLAVNRYTEFAFALRTNNAIAGKTYRLRLYNSTDSKTLNTYVNYPLLSIVAGETVRFSKGLYPVLPTGTIDLTYYLDPKGYGDVSADDNVNRDPLTSSTDYPIYNFVSKNSTNTQAITASWNGQSTVAGSVAAVYLQVYRFGSTNAWQTVASTSTSTANTDFTLSGNVNAVLSEYYDGSNWTYWRVYQAGGPETLRTDYFNAAFSAPVPVVYQKHYRWRADNGSQTSASWLEAEDVGSPTASSTLTKGVNVRLRLSAANLGGGSASTTRYQLQYATTTSNCAADPGGWTAVPTDNSRAFRMSTSTNFTDQATTSNQFTNSEGYTFVAGRMVKDPSNASATTTLAERNFTEIEYGFFATAAAGDGSTYCFRMTNNGSVLNYYDRLAELTLQGNPNTAPSFSVNPADGGSATSTPTNLGSAVIFTATGNDPENDSYYLAVCQAAGVTAGNDGPPTCNAGGWCVSALASSTVEATCSYTTATTSEVLPWYAYVCDRRAGVGVAKCSAASQGGSGTSDDSPFNINHPPNFSALFTSVNNQNPGGTFVINSTSSDSDTAGSADTLSFYVCRSNSATAAGCSGAATNTVCQVVATSSPNVSCVYTNTAPAPAGPYTYYGFIYDNHGLGAVANSRSSTYSINNVAPVIGALVLNGGANITLNMKGAPDKAVSTVSTSIEDQNGCATGLVSAVATIYMSNATGGYSCTANDNDCYQVTSTNCVKSDCTGDNDSLATYTCTANMKHFAVPTDASTGNPWEPYNWLSRLQVYDGSNYTASTSPAVELVTSQALNVTEDWINFGSNLYAGQNTGTTNSTTTVINAGNSPINTNLAGTDMTTVPSGNITVDNIKWDMSAGFNYPVGTSLSSAGQDVNTNLARATTTSDVFTKIYWGLGVPFGTTPATYTGQNIFTAILNVAGW